MRPIDELPVLAFSVAYELEIAGVVRMLQAAGIPPRRARARRRATRSSSPAGRSRSRTRCRSPGIVDAIVVGEADARVVEVVRALEGGARRAQAQLDALAAIPHVFVPAHHARAARPSAPRTTRSCPRYSAIRTPHTELSDMFLIETERGCSRGCTLLRDAPVDQRRHAHRARARSCSTIIPRDARRVGLVGAAVSDHPKIVDDRQRARRPRVRGGPLVAAPRSARDARRLRRRARARRLPHAHDRDGRHERARARARSTAARAPSTSCAAPSSRRSTAWTGSSST